jgi:N12 class adenine-specific DNA methylase
VLRRRRPDEQPLPFDWELTVEVDTADGSARINAWFAHQSEAVLGTLGLGGAHSKQGLTVTPAGDWATAQQASGRTIAERAAALDRTCAPRPGLPGPQTRARAAGHRLAAGSLALPEGASGPLVEVTSEGTRPVRLRNAREGEELRALVQLRDAARLVLSSQASGDPADTATWLRAQADLNRLYDRHAARWGRINDFRLAAGGFDQDRRLVERREPRAPARIRKDPGWPLLAALETVDPHSGQVAKAAIFTDRVVAPHRAPAGADTAAEALTACLGEHGRADLGRVAQLLGVDEPTARAELGELVYQDPGAPDGQGGHHLATAEAYLSGDVRTKLEQARAAAGHDAGWASNVAALEAALPADLTPAEIDARLGAPWVPVEHVTAFARELLDDDRVAVRHTALTATWKVEPSLTGRWSVAATSQWGTRSADACALLDDALNLRPTIVWNELEGGRRVRNESETIAAQEKRAAIEERFAAWLWEDPRRAAELARLYNERFNRLVLPSWDGSHLALPGLSAAFTPHQHQRDAVWRIVAGAGTGSGGNVLLGHAVGAGKTATMIMAGMEMRRLGLVNKPLCVVPNHMLDQFARELAWLYPNARVLVAGKDDLARGARQEFAARCAAGVWDAVVMTHASFGRLPVSPATERRFLARERDQYAAALEKAREDRDRLTVKQIAKALKRFDERLEALADRAQDIGAIVSFESLGADYLFVDEGHCSRACRSSPSSRSPCPARSAPSTCASNSTGYAPATTARSQRSRPAPPSRTRWQRSGC